LRKENYEGNFDALLTMFVDMSGFTSMTQALMKHGHEGAEILASVAKLLDCNINSSECKSSAFAFKVEL
jgi:hypothetical protein